jgi:hypothetical protein
MTNSQTRMLASSIGLIGGAIISQTDNLNINLSIVIILITFAMLLVEYSRSWRSE